MTDPGLVFMQLATLHHDVTFGMRSKLFPDIWHALIDLCVWAPVVENGGFFEPHPRGREAPAKAWRWVLAQRFGLSNAHNRAAGEPFHYFDDDIDDLFVAAPDLSRLTSSLLGLSPVLGQPAEPSTHDPPVRVHATPLGWLRARGHGVVLSPDRGLANQWLRDCAPGVVADDLPHGEALMARMRKPLPPLPRVLVAT